MENLQKYLDENTSGIKVVSKRYEDKGYQNVLYVTLLLPNGQEKEVLWNEFRRKKDKNFFTERWNEEKAFNFCIDNGFTPIKEAKFENVDKTFPCQDKEGFIYMISISNLKRAKRNNFGFNKTRNNPYALYNIKLFCKLYRPEYEILDTEIKEVKDLYKFRYNGPLDSDIPREFYISLDYFINGRGGFVGNNISKEANFVASLLRQHNEIFTLEKTFKDLKSHKGHSLRFDFALYDNKGNLTYLIEYDSIIHFQFVPIIHKTEKEFKSAQERDRIKNSYCLSHNIPLIRIPYWALKDLTYEKIFNTPQYLVKSKFHNDYLTPP